ncbi:MAG: ATP-binding cassette domain-containing protein [Planctomycetales bacterium]|nr:ATP-binding cassette domain-containing protein [Planctomycetales bacterium]
MIEVHELTKEFERADGSRLVAVDHLSFSVGAGEVYGLLGPNGAGKTTTLRMIMGLLAPTSGYATVDDFRTNDDVAEVRRRIGLVQAGTGMYQWLTVHEMLSFFADLYGVDESVAEERLARLVKLLEMGSYEHRRCSTLSTGERQRVNLARALIHDPPVMLLDEPTTGIDVLGSQVVVEYVRYLRECGKAVIVSTHRLDEAERLCDRYGLVNKGQMAISGTLAELLARTETTNLVDAFLKVSHTGQALLSAGAGEADA